MNKIRLLIVEDNKLQREGIKAMLKEQDDIQVVAALGEKVQVIDKIHDLEPDILLLDIGLPNYNILKLVSSLRKNFHGTKVILMGLLPVQSEVNHYVNAGARGFISKDASVDEFLAAIRAVAEGETAFPQKAGESMISKIVEDEVRELRASKLIKSLRMTDGEKEVLLLVAEGLTDMQIALKLKVSEYTVKGQVDNILEKMALNTRVQISIYLNSDEETAGDGISPKAKKGK